jgi:hypothetical protein
VQIITQDGHDRVVLDRAEYEDLLDARDHAATMHDIAAGAPTLGEADMDAYLASPSPLAFWRSRAGKSLADLASDIGEPEHVVAEIDGGLQHGTVSVMARIARSLNVRIEDLVEDDVEDAAKSPGVVMLRTQHVRVLHRVGFHRVGRDRVGVR